MTLEGEFEGDFPTLVSKFYPKFGDLFCPEVGLRPQWFRSCRAAGERLGRVTRYSTEKWRFCWEDPTFFGVLDMWFYVLNKIDVKKMYTYV